MVDAGTTRNGNSREAVAKTCRRGACAGLCRFAFVLSLMFLGTSLSHASRYQGQQAPAPIERRPPPSPGARSNNGTNTQTPHGSYHGPRGEHLADWMSQHSALSLQQQQQALDQEPGFHELPQETQQRYRNRLAQLDAMNPQRRQQLLARNEAMERLTPDQRAQVRGALGQLGSLPLDQRRVVASAFRSLREIPPDQRYAALNSGRLGPPLNGAQRAALGNLLAVEPMVGPMLLQNRPSQPGFQQPAQPMQPGYPR